MWFLLQVLDISLYKYSKKDVKNVDFLYLDWEGGACVVAGGACVVAGGACVVAGGTCVVARGGMRGCWGGMRGCQGGVWLPGGACVVAGGGMHGCRGACVVAGGVCMVARGHAWLRGGMRGWSCDTHAPPCGQTDTCKNITFANFVCGR